MRYAELTGSSTKPLPSHSPWSGGSNVCSKLVNWLSRLLTPSKLTIGELVAAAATAADAGEAGIVSVAEKWPDGSRRAALGPGADGAPAAGAVLGTSRAIPGVPVYCVTAGTGLPAEADARATVGTSPAAIVARPAATASPPMRDRFT